MAATITWDDAPPKMRASETNERGRLVSELAELDATILKLNGEYERTGDGPQFVRRIRTAGERREFLAAQLRDFDSKLTERTELAESAGAAKAKAAFNRAVLAFEKTLDAFSRASVAAFAAADEYAAASGERDPGRHPHRHVVKPALSMRAHYVLAASGLKFEKHSPSNVIPSLSDRWNCKEQA